MKDSREDFIKRFLCAQTNTKIFNKESLRLYSFFLHEDLYLVIFQNTYFFEKSSSSVFIKSNIKKYQRASFLTIKYIIFLFRSNNFYGIKRSLFSHARSHNHKKDSQDYDYLQLKKKILFYLIFESIAFILLCSQKKSFSEKSFLRTKKCDISISIHKPFSSIENQWQYSSFGFQGCFYRFFHPEILVRILRKRIHDICFLHLIRKFLHSKLYLSNNTFKSCAPAKKIRNILWNIYVLEIDNFFVSNCKDYSPPAAAPVSSNYSLSVLQKIKEWTSFLLSEEYKGRRSLRGTLSPEPEGLRLRSTPSPRGEDPFAGAGGDPYDGGEPGQGGKLAPMAPCGEAEVTPYKVFYTITIRDSEERSLDKRRQISFLAQSSSYNYLRTNTNWFLFFQEEKSSSWNCLIKRRIMQFFIRRLGYAASTPISSTFSSPGSMSEWLLLSPLVNQPYCFFLAYILQLTNRRDFVKINTKLFFLINYFVRRVVYFFNPFYLITLILSKQNFCNSFGYPKRKSGWVTWTDNDIISHFNRIQTSLFFFYSGCNNSKALSRIQYILHFSCAKTLACKHKTNIQHICKKFGNNLKFKDFSKGLSFFVGEPTAASSPSSTFFVTNQSKKFRLRSLCQNQKRTRFWNFHLTQMDSIILHLEDFYRLVKI